MPVQNESIPTAGSYEGVAKLQTPEEELAYLRERVAQKEREIGVHKEPFESNRIAKREVAEYQNIQASDVLHDAYAFPQSTILQEKLRLEPEEHDTQVTEILNILQEKGIKNALSVVAKIGSAHLEDDIHRALVQYVAQGLPMRGIKQSSEVYKATHMTLYEVSLDRRTANDEQKGDSTEDIQKLIGSMEQFYAGILSSVGSGSLKNQEVISLEIANQNGSEEVVLYIAVPNTHKELFEKHMTATFPHSHTEELRGDYNIFSYGGAHTGAYGVLKKSDAYPLREYKDLVYDPLNTILSAFSHLSKHNEGAAIQIVIGDSGDMYNRQYQNVIEYLNKGESAKKAIKYGMKPFSEAADSFKKEFVNAIFNKKDDSDKEKRVDEKTIERISAKTSTKVVPTTIRIVASSQENARSKEMIHTIASAFKQFDDPQGNEIIFKEATGAKLRKLLHEFTYRSINLSHISPLALWEIAMMYHVSGSGIIASRELKKAQSKQVSAPIEVGSESANTANNAGYRDESTAQSEGIHNEEGIILGENKFGATKTAVRFKPVDRRRHFYEVGQTGTGKTNLMKNMIIQDIKNGEGCCYIDPHGSDIVDVLAAIPPERYDDVIYFDPAHIERPMGMNMLEFDPQHPEQKTFVVNEIFSIFEKLFMKKSPESLGPMFEQYFRNATLLVLEGMEQGTATFTDIPRVLSDTAFRHECIAHSQNVMVNKFWTDIAETAGGDGSLENIVPYITAKTDIFLNNDFMRPIITQQKSAFSFADIMDSKKILLVNLAKGKIGDINSELLGLIVVGKFLQAALSRVTKIEQNEAIDDFYLYIDEFQNFTTNSIAVILSEARKYGLSLNVAHQFIAQLDEDIRNAVFGNIGTKCVFRVSTEDAEFLEKEFKPEFSASDIANLDNFNAYLSMLSDGKPIRPFNITTLPPSERDFSQVEKLKQLSHERYGRPREDVEQELLQKLTKHL